MPAHRLHGVVCAARHVLHVRVGHEGTKISMIIGVGLMEGRSVVVEGRVVFEVLWHHEVAGNLALPAQIGHIVRVCSTEHLKRILVLAFDKGSSSEIEHF